VQDIGIYMDILELVSSAGIVACVYIVVFTSQKLEEVAPIDINTLYIYAFLALHCLFALKFILALLIEDVPGWVAEDMEHQKHRMEQLAQDNQDKKLMERLERYQPLDLLFEVIEKQHEMEELSGQLVPKLYEGVKKFMEMNEAANDLDEANNDMNATGKLGRTGMPDDFNPVFRRNQERKLQ
jgi:hypothetical protein